MAVLHYDGALHLDGLVCHRKASFPTEVISAVNNNELLLLSSRGLLSRLSVPIGVRCIPCLGPSQGSLPRLSSIHLVQRHGGLYPTRDQVAGANGAGAIGECEYNGQKPGSSSPPPRLKRSGTSSSAFDGLLRIGLA